ncbi:MAG: hypothetical protein FWC43_00885 [Planctomycetaceae bacterium]|nr:hypothetical protein [Planctomycetaceae bacterium]
MSRFCRLKTFVSLILFFICLSATLPAAELKILKPLDRGKPYDIAAEEFQKYFELCTGRKLAITTEPNETDHFVVIGSDAVNRFCRDCIEKKVLRPFRIRTGTDDYHLLSARDGDRDLLFLAGGRGRSTLYAVYQYFELRGGCSWFWDGDVVPKSESLDITNLDVAESPRFEYRGLRYFAHRSLTRFQAEHWGPKDWEQEIDWIVKKRLNVFMLRIGMDDVFQKAFPDVVPYPDNDKPLPEAIPDGCNDRTTFWPLQYRGELRKHLLRYAFDRDLMHPEDFGTMTHWYSRTPIAFLEHFNPEFLAQSGGDHREQTGLVWDIRNDKWLDLYFKLTETHIEHYGKPELFHTIGLAERLMFPDRADNLEIKLYTYRRLIAKVREKYPNAPILLAGWDFHHTWKPEEVPALFKELDPRNTILWDYEADSITPKNYTNWDVIGKFPYIFGIFEALTAAADIRANYDVIEQRIALSADDPFCKGYIFWPEVSHADILMLEYFPHNAWKPDQPNPIHAAKRLCQTRYGGDAEALLTIWEMFLPTTYPYTYVEAWEPSISWHFSNPNLFFVNWDRSELRKTFAEKLAPAPALYRALAELPFDDAKPFIKRDAIDIARTTANKLAILAMSNLNVAIKNRREGKGTSEEVLLAAKRFQRHWELFRDLLSLHDDYSMNATYERLKTVAEVNPCFEQTLIANGGNSYCASYQYELFAHCYLPIVQAYTEAVEQWVEAGDAAATIDLDALQKVYKGAFANVQKKSLAEMKPTAPQTAERYRQIMLDLADVAEELVKTL